MKIVAFNQFFWPDQAATSQLLTDLVRRLALEGHEVTVVCGAPGYAGTDEDSRPPVKIRPSPSLPFSRGAVGRMASYCSYLASAAWHTLLLGRVDVVITMTTPPMLSLLGNLGKMLHGAHHVVWEMDVYPEIATDVGVIRPGSILARVLTAIAHRSRRYADIVWVLGDCMRQRIVDAGCSPERVEVHENWSDAALYVGPVEPTRDRLRVLYSGNLGLSHDVETLGGALCQLRDDSRVSVQIAGGGCKRERLETFARAQHLSNVEFLPYCSKRDLGHVLSSADVGLVTLQRGCEGAVVPSKVYGLMACGRPILFVGSDRTTPAAIIRRFDCGWRVDCGDIDGLAGTLRRLAAQPALVRDAGRRARTAFLEHYDADRAVARLCRSLERSVESSPDRPGSPKSVSAVLVTDPRNEQWHGHSHGAVRLRSDAARRSRSFKEWLMSQDHKRPTDVERSRSESPAATATSGDSAPLPVRCGADSAASSAQERQVSWQSSLSARRSADDV